MRTLMFLGLIALAPGYALAAPTQIVVTGEGIANAMPDMATESFTISTNAPSAAEAMSENNSRYSKLLSGMQALGIAQSDVQTSSYSLNYTPRPQPPDVAAPGQRYGYFVERSIDVTLHRTSLVGKAIDAAAASGVTDIGGVTFGVSNRKTQLAQALRAAVTDARGQAESLADAAGLHIVRVRQIQQGYEAVPPPRPVMMRTMAAAEAPVPTQIQPSAVQARATVTVTYDAQ